MINCETIKFLDFHGLHMVQRDHGLAGVRSSSGINDNEIEPSVSSARSIRIIYRVHCQIPYHGVTMKTSVRSLDYGATEPKSSGEVSHGHLERFPNLG